MSLHKCVARLAYVCLFVTLASGIIFAQEPERAESARPEGRDQVGSVPDNFEKGEDGSFQRQRDEYFFHPRAYPHKHIPAGVRLRALKQLDRKLAAEKQAKALKRVDGQSPQSGPVWTSIGPQPVDNFGALVSSGRVAAVAVDQTNDNIVYAGAADGGVWKTTDGGQTWTAITDQQASLAVGSIAIDPENHNTIYVGTGEENQAVDNYYGAGILKSTDGGNTWTNIPGPFAGGSGGGARIGGLAVSPTNSNVVLAAVGCCAPNTSGVYLSNDAGNTWTNVLNFNGNQAFNVVFNPTNGNIAYASVDYDGVWESTNAGATWTAVNGTGANVLPTGSNAERVALAMDPNNPLTLYAGISNNSTGGMLGLYKTTDGGQNWLPLSNAPNLCGGQCWYDFVLAVQPGNSSTVFGGGSGWGNQLYQSLDGGNTWTLVPPNGAIHPDLHALAFTSDGTTLYIGNDGGMYSATQPGQALSGVNSLNGGTGTGTGLATLQFYAGPAIHPTNVNDGFGGTQDNGGMQYSGSLTWTGVGPCGDAARNIFDTTTPTNLYVTCVQLGVFKSTDGGNTYTQVQNGIDPNGTDSLPWVAPFAMDPSNTQNLYFGTNFIYQTTNGASQWAAISPDFTGGTGNLSGLAVSPVNSNTVYATANGGNGPLVYVTNNALAGTGATWSNISGSIFPNRYVNLIAADPKSASIAYAGFSGFTGYGDSVGHIFMTTNGGSSWADISGDLPNTPVNDIFVDPDMSQTIFVATDIGVFYTTNLGVSWGTLVENLPRAATTGLAYQHANQLLWAGTHGRSMWSASLAGLAPVPGVTALSPSSALVGGAAFTLTVNGDGFNSSSVVQWNGSSLVTTYVSASEIQAQVPAGDLTVAGDAAVTVANPGATVSNAATFAVDNPVPGIVSLVPNSAVAGGPGFTLTVNGSSLVNGAQVLWNGSALTTTFVSVSQVMASVPASDIAKAGTAQVSVSNPAPGGGASGTLPFAIVNPAPTLTTISPSEKVAGGASFTLIVKGSSFVSGAVVQWNGSNQTTTFVKSTELKATITAAEIASPGTFPITATNPGSATSNAVNFTVENPKPTLTSLNPSSATHGGPAFTLTVTGTDFVPGSVVNWKNSARATTYISSTKVTAQILAGDIAKKGKVPVDVTNPKPGGGKSSALTFTVD